MNYNEMSDFEINKAVLERVSDFPVHPTPKQKGSAAGTYVATHSVLHWYDFCKNWADAGPIIEKHLICMAADVFAEPQDGGKWVAQPAYGWDSERVRSDNPLRAAMIVFLMMMEEK